MRDARGRELDDVPAPRTRARWWQPPEAKWTGRLVFAAAGFVLGAAGWLLGGGVTAWIAYDDGGWVLKSLFAALPWIVGVGVIALRIRKGPAWRWPSYLAGVLLTVVLPVLLLLGWMASDALRHMRDFDAEAWKAQSGQWGEDRVQMVDDLLNTHDFVGRPVAEVDALLGPDDGDHGTGSWTGYFPDRERIWHLGPQRGVIAIDSEFLVLDVEDGVVTDVDLVTD